jgi:hypothetical protein
MSRLLISALLVGATLLTAGCTNSVLNDPKEMARREAFVQRQQAGWDRFWGSGSGSSQTSAGSSQQSRPWTGFRTERQYEELRRNREREERLTCIRTGGRRYAARC